MLANWIIFYLDLSSSVPLSPRSPPRDLAKSLSAFGGLSLFRELNSLTEAQNIK